MQPEPEPLRSLRKFLLGLFLVGAAGAMAELLLAGHWEDPWQYTPLLLLTCGILAGAFLAASGGARRLVVFRGLMVLFVVSGFLGLGLHYTGNTEFVLESQPSLSGLALFWKAIKGKSPPTLAPGAMMALGMVGWAWTFRNKALAHTADILDTTGEST